ncbi:MAG: IS6 family transposase [Acidobacteriaceae bacterium]|nr:IS6 family transposase [Acidobacteriaceae bacterium]
MPTDIVFQVVLFRLLFKLSLRDLAQMFLIRGYELSHETVRDWEARFAPLLADQVRRRRKGKVGRCWYVDETYLKVSGQWVYLYRAIDKQGQLIDSMLSPKRDRAAAQRFFRRAQTVAGRRPEQVTTDGHNSYPRALAEVLGKKVKHRCSRYKNNRIEIVFTQMTKTSGFAAGMSRDHIADLHLVIGHQDSIHEEFHQSPFLCKAGVG